MPAGRVMIKIIIIGNNFMIIIRKMYPVYIRHVVFDIVVPIETCYRM